MGRPRPNAVCRSHVEIPLGYRFSPERDSLNINSLSSIIVRRTIFFKWFRFPQKTFSQKPTGYDPVIKSMPYPNYAVSSRGSGEGSNHRIQAGECCRCEAKKCKQVKKPFPPGPNPPQSQAGFSGSGAPDTIGHGTAALIGTAVIGTALIGTHMSRALRNPAHAVSGTHAPEPKTFGKMELWKMTETLAKRAKTLGKHGKRPSMRPGAHLESRLCNRGLVFLAKIRWQCGVKITKCDEIPASPLKGLVHAGENPIVDNRLLPENAALYAMTTCRFF